MKYLISVLLLSVALFANDLGWSHDYNATVEKAKKSKKLVYTLITSDSCRWCRKFESTTLQNEDIKKRLYEEFEVVHISRDRDEVPAGFETSPVPRHYFTNTKGEILYSSLGHRELECFFSFMDNAQNKNKTSK
jgi:thioredoxin-related protein